MKTLINKSEPAKDIYLFALVSSPKLLWKQLKNQQLDMNCCLTFSNCTKNKDTRFFHYPLGVEEQFLQQWQDVWQKLITKYIS